MNNENQNNSLMTNQTIQQQQFNSNVNNNQISEPNQNKNNNNKTIIIVIVAIIIIGLCVFGYTKIMKNKDTTLTNNNNQQTKTNNKEDNNTNPNSNVGTVDSNLNLSYDETGAFLMSIEDVFTTEKGTFATGIIDRGKISLGDTVQILGLDSAIITTTVQEIEMVKKKLETAEAGYSVRILLKDVSSNQIKKGQVLAQPNSIATINKFEAQIYVLTKEEGGRHTPFFSNYRPTFYFKNSGVGGEVTFPKETEMVMPGDNVLLTVKLNVSVAMEVGTKFTIREGERIVGKGTVTKVY